MKKKTWIAIALVVMLMLMTGCGQSAQTDNQGTQSSDNSVYIFGSSAVGGNQHTMGVAMEQLINQKVSGFKFSSQATGGNVQNLNLLKVKEIDMGFATGTLARAAMDGTGQFEGKAVDNVQILTFMYPGIVHVIVHDDNISSLRELKGKRISVGEVGSVMELYFNNLIAAYDMTQDDFKVEHLSHQDASDAIKDGSIDAFVYVTTAPTSIVTELTLQDKAHVISIEKDIRQKVVELFPDMYLTEIPAKTYENQEEPITTVGAAFLIVIDKDIPEDVGYQITKVLYENAAELAAQNNIFSYISLDNSLKGLAGVPIHSGAKKYYEEQGLEVE